MLLKNLPAEFGIEDRVLDEFKYIIKGNDVFFINRNWNDPHPEIFDRVGLRFGTINKENKIVLSSHAAQVLSKQITNKILEIKKEELSTYLKGETIKSIHLPKEQYIVKFDKYTLGTAVSTSDGLKSQFPRAFRTQAKWNSVCISLCSLAHGSCGQEVRSSTWIT